MRLNRYISSSGFCSRRKADEFIAQKKVTINGEVAVIGQVVGPEDKVHVNGQLITAQNKYIYIALNKPVGITSTTETHVKGNIIDFVNHKERIFPIGRLDKNSDGLILLTNDGLIVNEILREENNIEKDYLVTVNKKITSNFIEQMSNGVKIFNPVKNKYTITKRCKVTMINDRMFKITLSQGLNRQIRRMCSRLNYRVERLQRVRVGNITLDGLPVGKWRDLTKDEVQKLRTKGK